MNNVKIINDEAELLCDRLGIPNDRAQELGDYIGRQMQNKQLYVDDLMVDISNRVRHINEFGFCMHLVCLHSRPQIQHVIIRGPPPQG